MSEPKYPFASIPEAVEDIRQGRMIVVVDDEDRENEGDLTIAAEKVTPEVINFMAKFGRGLICLAMTQERCDALSLAPITPRNTSLLALHFASRSTPAWDHHRNQRVGSRDDDIDGHRPENPARRSGAAGPRATPCERGAAGCWCAPDRPKRAWTSRGLPGSTSGVICEIMNDDGSMARMPQLIEFCKLHGLKLVSIADLIRYRMQHERYVQRVAASRPADAVTASSR